MMLRISPVKQTFGLCGAACFKMVMDYYGVHHSMRWWANSTAVKCTKRGTIVPIYGCSEYKFMKTVKTRGFHAAVKDHSSIAEVARLLQQKVPVIVDWFSPEEGAHFSVVVGLTKKYIFLVDPHFGMMRKHQLSWFLERWFDAVPYPLKRIEDVILRRMIVVRSRK